MPRQQNQTIVELIDNLGNRTILINGFNGNE